MLGGMKGGGFQRRRWRPATTNKRVPAVCLQYVIKARQKRQTCYIPKPIPQSTITSLNSSTPDDGARAHPVVLTALPARAARSVFFCCHGHWKTQAMGLSGSMDEGGVGKIYLMGDQAAFISIHVGLHVKFTCYEMFSRQVIF